MKGVPFTPAELLTGKQKFPRGEAAGAKDFFPAHLLELCSVSSAENVHDGFLKALTNFVICPATARVPTCLAPWFLAAPFTPLCKRNDGIRPIAVGETFRSLVSAFLTTRVGSQAQQFLEPIHLGVKTRAGREAIVHAARPFLHSHGKQATHALLQVDLANAFNLVSRSASLKATCKNFPEL